jgi:hypothetical protein
MSPTIESLCLALGAKHVSIVDYNQLTYEHPQLTTYTVADWDAARKTETKSRLFDVVLSISSFDHDGLGR